MLFEFGLIRALNDKSMMNKIMRRSSLKIIKFGNDLFCRIRKPKKKDDIPKNKKTL